MDPSNPRIMFAGMWQLEIHTWGRESGGPGSGLFMTRDGGVTWTKLTGHGLPTKPVGKVMPAIAHSNPRRVYAAIETGDGLPWNGQATDRGQLWRSDDGGENWKLVNADRNILGRTAYYGRMAVSTDNENETYYLNASFSKSIDGGATLVGTQGLESPGGDHHDMWIDPTNGNRMIVAHDQGVSVSQTRGRTWLKQRTKNAQLYHVTVDNQIPYYVYTNKQDGPSYRGPSNSRLDEGGGRGGGGGGRGGIPRGMWHSIDGGESGFATPDPVDPNIIWSTASGSGSVGGIVVRYEENRRQSRNVEVWPDNSNGIPADLKYRFVWDAPFHISPHDHNKVYVGSQHLHQSVDGGQSWQEISPDVTLNDKSKQQMLRRTDAGQHRRRIRRRDPRDFRIAEAGRCDLGRHQRRARAGDARRRESLDQRHEEHAQPAAVGNRRQHRGVALRCRDRLRHRRFPSGEQPRSVRLPDQRLRRELEADHERHPALDAQLRALHPRGHGEARSVVPRHRERGLRLVRRWGELAAAAEQPAARAGLLARRPGALQRSRDRDLRPRRWILDDITPLREMTSQVLNADAHLFPCARRIGSDRSPRRPRRTTI